MSLETGKREKQLGLDLVTDHNQDFVAILRAYAEAFCLNHGTVTTDDLRDYADEHGLQPNHPNAWGAIFRGKRFVEAGRVKSRRTSNHAREIRRWALRLAPGSQNTTDPMGRHRVGSASILEQMRTFD